MKITVRQLKSLIREAMAIAAPTARAGVPIHGVVDAYAGLKTRQSPLVVELCALLQHELGPAGPVIIFKMWR